MCGRYTLHTPKKQLAKSIALTLHDDYEPDYNISPGKNALSIASNDRYFVAASIMNWGLRTPQNFHINARIESANTNPRFRESWLEHRCLLPANGFYEWCQDGVSKKPHYIYEQGKTIQFYAGIYFPNKENNQISSFVVLTTEAQAPISRIHKRFPVIIRVDAHSSWLSGEMNKSDLHAISRDVNLSSHTVSNHVNRVQNNDMSLIQATSFTSDEQMMLF